MAQQAVEALVFVAETLSYPVHQGIKPSNFVIRRNGGNNVEWVCKLTHLGFSERIEDSEKIPWTAPESSAKSSVWSMGCVLHFIFTGGQHPYGETMKERLDNIPNCQPLITGRTVLVRMSRTQFRPDLLIAEMIQRDPYRRHAMEAVVQRIQEWQLSSDKELKPFISPDLSFQVARSTNWTSLFYVVLLLMVQCLLVYIYYYSLRSN